MGVGMSNATGAAYLNATFHGDNLTAPTQRWMKLHTGEPGPAGALNPATEVSRRQITCSTATFPSSGVVQIASSLDMLWDPITTSGPETPNRCTFWDHPTLTTGFLGSGNITSTAVNNGDQFKIAAGAFTVSLITAS